MKIDTCIFDLDGTLLDTITTITYYVNETLVSYGKRKLTLEECKSFVGNGAVKLMRRAFDAVGDEGVCFEEALDAYIANYDTDPYYLTAPYPGIPALLSRLKSRGIKLAVLSNKQDSSTKSVVEHFFPGVFDCVMGGIDGVPLKPDPSVARMILDKLGSTAERTAWIGDTPVDVKTGQNLGAALTLGVSWGFRDREELIGAGADVIVDTAEQILSEVGAVV